MNLMRFFLSAVLVVSLGAQANDRGDYDWWTSIVHLISPASPNNRITDAQISEPMYPLTRFPKSFSRSDFDPYGYYKWQVVEMPPSTGAMCMDGSPYKIFVNRVNDSSNLLIYFQAGGVCTDYASCTGQAELSASNPHGISDDFIADPLSIANRYISPLIVRVHPTSRVKTQGWNIIYAPYCSGDLYAGDRSVIFKSNKGRSILIQHRGLKNARSVVSWAKENLERPVQLMVAGSSAGGAASQLNYAHIRQDMEPNYSFLLNDSGPLFKIDSEESPAFYTFDFIRKNFGLDEGYFKFMAQRIAGVDKNNPFSVYSAYSVAFPNDRMGMTYFWQDKTYPDFSYQLHPRVLNAKSPEERAWVNWELSHQDVQALWEGLSNLSNVGAFFPQYRDVLNSHMLAALDFRHSDIQEENLEFKDFIADLMDGKSGMMHSSEKSDLEDKKRPFLSWTSLSDYIYILQQAVGIAVDTSYNFIRYWAL